MNGFIVYDHHWHIWGFGPDVMSAWTMAEGNLDTLPQPTRTRRYLRARMATPLLLEAIEEGRVSSAQWTIHDGVAHLMGERKTADV